MCKLDTSAAARRVFAAPDPEKCLGPARGARTGEQVVDQLADAVRFATNRGNQAPIFRVESFTTDFRQIAGNPVDGAQRRPQVVCRVVCD